MVVQVWLCSGQSNMEWTINAVRHGLQEIDTAVASYQDLRLIKVERSPATQPLLEPPGFVTQVRAT